MFTRFCLNDNSQVKFERVLVTQTNQKIDLKSTEQLEKNFDIKKEHQKSLEI